MWNSPVRAKGARIYPYYQTWRKRHWIKTHRNFNNPNTRPAGMAYNAANLVAVAARRLRARQIREAKQRRQVLRRALKNAVRARKARRPRTFMGKRLNYTS